mgnify:CR=1 FL=1
MNVNRRTRVGLLVVLAIGSLATAFLLRPKGEPPVPGGAQPIEGSPVREPDRSAQATMPDRQAATRAHVVRVFDSNGRPVSEAMCFAGPAAGLRRRGEADDGWLGATDDSGVLRYPWSAADAFVVSVERPGFFPDSRPMLSDLTFVLAPAVSMEVECVDEFAKPIADAEISLRRHPITNTPGAVGTDERLVPDGYSARSGPDGIARIEVSPGDYFLAARSEGRIPSVDGTTSMLRAAESCRKRVTFSTLWVAGVSSSGGGHFVAYAFETSGSRGIGRQTTAGRKLYLEVVERHPDSLLTTATWDAHGDEKKTVFTAFHSVQGWIRRELPYLPMREFVPEELAFRSGPAVSSFIQVDATAPDDAPVELEGCSFRGGPAYGTELDASTMASVPPDERQRLFSTVPLEVGVPVEVPPGTHVVVCRDGVVAAAIGGRIGRIQVAPGETQRRSVRLPFAIEPIEVRILGPAGREVIARVSVAMDGKTLSRYTIGTLGPDQGVIVRPSVPRNIPFDLVVEPLGLDRTVENLVIPRGQKTLVVRVGE